MAYEVRAMSFGEILDNGFGLVRDHFLLLVGLSALVNVPFALVSEGIGWGHGTFARFAIVIGFGLYMLVVAPIVSTAVTYAVAEVFVGRPVTAGAALRRVVGLIGPLTVTSLLSVLAVGLGLVLLVIPGLYLMLAFMLVWQVVVIEGVSGAAALRRSRALMGGNLLRGFGVLFLGAVISELVSGVLHGAVSFAGNPLLTGLAGGLAQAAASAFTAAVGVVLYFDVRCRHEAFDLEHLARLVAANPGAQPQTA
jgi:hypothetical protein